jgi:hypothetical protein
MLIKSEGKMTYCNDDALKHEKIKKQAEHRTATTTYPCYLPILGDSAGAGRAGLPRRKIRKISHSSYFLSFLLS